ncbi:alpha/beta fold hydrolase [Paraburkholderia sp. LEh10]|uniref:alpha/beta fold hydrolase n=1 Tax=Paraburkholderia sp. LEh10 TaxID=2821353 RepID=UPI001FD747D4|nr:alpha/beta hydrolase [Paraburkholderia sp. LEh10]
MSRYTDDLAELIEHLDLKDAVLAGHSTRGSGLARDIGRHDTQRVRKAVLIAAVLPLMLKTPANPATRAGLPVCNARTRALTTASLHSRKRLHRRPEKDDHAYAGLHGDADRIVPRDDSGKLSSMLVPNGKLKVCEGAPHGICTTRAHLVNADLLQFIQA